MKGYQATDVGMLPKQTMSASWADRSRILTPDVNLFCWQRTMDETTQKYLASRVNEHLFNRSPPPVTMDISRESLATDIASLRENWDGRRRRTDADNFWQDVEELASDFIQFSPSGSGTLTLQVVRKTLCPKFHMDWNYLRLLTTYHGKGTEWLPEETTNRCCLGTMNERIVKDRSKVRRLQTFDVGIFKGAHSENQIPIKGIVHRSPEVEKPEEKRIILRIDLD
eukprot:jgi/Bigna1/137875/aug1.41_g12583